MPISIWGFFVQKFPLDFLFSLASLDSFPPGEAIGCCRTRGFIDSLKSPIRGGCSGFVLRFENETCQKSGEDRHGDAACGGLQAASEDA